MKTWTLTPAMLILLVGTTALAERPQAGQNGLTEPSPSDAEFVPGMSSEIWWYLQEAKRHDDPKQAVRRNAEFRAAQRRKRLAALKWFGLSNQRPVASPTPFLDLYSPFWSGNGGHRFRWIGQGCPATALRIEQVAPRW